MQNFVPVFGDSLKLPIKFWCVPEHKLTLNNFFRSVSTFFLRFEQSLGEKKKTAIQFVGFALKKNPGFGYRSLASSYFSKALQILGVYRVQGSLATLCSNQRNIFSRDRTS